MNLEAKGNNHNLVQCLSCQAVRRSTAYLSFFYGRVLKGLGLGTYGLGLGLEGAGLGFSFEG